MERRKEKGEVRRTVDEGAKKEWTEERMEKLAGKYRSLANNSHQDSGTYLR